MHLKSKLYNIAIVGINRESAAVLSTLINTQAANVIRIVNDETEDFSDLKKLPQLDIIINTTNDVSVYQKLKKLNLENVDVLSGLSGRILFSTGPHQKLPSALAEDKAKLLNSLHEIREAIYLSKNKEELLKLVLNVAIRSSQADSGSIMLLDAQKRTLKIEVAEGLDMNVVVSAISKVGKGIAGTVAKTGKPLLIKGAADRERYATEFERNDLISSICVPLIIGKEVVGVLSINSKASERIFFEDDVQYIKKLADFTVDIIKTSKEYEKSASNTFSLSLLNNVRDILALSYGFEERLNLLILKVVNEFHGEICNYYDYFADKKVFMVKASSSFNIKLLKGKKLKLNEYFSKQVATSEDTVVQSIPHKDGYVKKWYIAQPVKVNGDMTGLLFLHFESSKETMKEEISILRKISEMIGLEQYNAQEMESIRVQSVKFSAISEVSFDLAAAQTIHDLATIIISNACIILEAETCILRLYNGTTSGLEVLDSFSLKSSSHLKSLESLDKRMCEDVITSKDTLLIKDISKTLYSSWGGDTKSALCMYLERDGRVLGTLSLYDKKSLDLFSTRCFSSKDKEIFLNFCLQASKALDRFIPHEIPLDIYL